MPMGLLPVMSMHLLIGTFSVNFMGFGRRELFFSCFDNLLCVELPAADVRVKFNTVFLNIENKVVAHICISMFVNQPTRLKLKPEASQDGLAEFRRVNLGCLSPSIHEMYMARMPRAFSGELLRRLGSIRHEFGRLEYRASAIGIR